MNMEKEQCMLDYFTGDLTPEDKKSFDDWLHRHPDKREEFIRMAKTWHGVRWSQSWNGLDDEGAYLRMRTRLRRRRLYMLKKYAAVILFLLGTGFLFRHWTMQPPELPIASLQSAPDPASPVLTWQNGFQISLGTRQQIIGAVAGKGNVRLVDPGHLEYLSIADTLISEPEYNTLTIPIGCEFSLTLADGTRVWLNAGSTLGYPEFFTGGLREVSLSGEAYFEVAHNENAPFRIQTDDMYLEVLGTCFNIRAYRDEDASVTTLISGCIRQFYPAIARTVEVLPEQQTVFDRSANRLQVVDADIEEAMAWKNGKFIARDQRLEDIMKMLGRWYNFDVIYTRPHLKDVRFHLHCQRYDNIQPILENMSATQGIRLDYYNGTIYVSD